MTTRMDRPDAGSDTTLHGGPGVAFEVGQYRPGNWLDEELAELAYGVMRGWPDQRPVTPALVRSRLAVPPAPESAVPAADLAARTEAALDVAGLVVTALLVTARDRRGLLIGAAALRPGTPGGRGRLWGPGVDPSHQGQGIGRRLLEILTTEAEAQAEAESDAQSGAQGADRVVWDGVTTAEVPLTRSRARSFLTAAGWIAAADLVLLRRTLPLRRRAPARATSRRDGLQLIQLTQLVGTSSRRELDRLAPDLGRELNRELAQLYQARFRSTPQTIAAATLQRWASDERFSPGCLTLAYRATPSTNSSSSTNSTGSSDSTGSARRPAGDLVGAALVYPLAHTHPGEPTEALLADLIVHPDLDDRPGRGQLLRRDLAAAALSAAAERFEARTARALLDRSDIHAISTLADLGFGEPGHPRSGQFRTYRHAPTGHTGRGVRGGGGG